MKYFQFLLFLFFSIPTFSQTPKIVWEKNIGFSKNDQASKIIFTSDKHLMVLGYIQPENRYDLDLFVAKLNLKGEVIWEKSFGTDKLEKGFDLVEDAEGNFILVGSAHVENKQSQVWVLKINPNGDLLWERKYGTKNNDVGRTVFINADAELIIGGMMEGILTSINHAYWLVLDTNGNVLNEKTFGGDHFEKQQLTEDISQFGYDRLIKGETCHKIIPNKNGGYLFVGTTITKAKSNLATDGWLVKLNSNGQLIWDKAFGAIGGDNLTDIFQNEKNEIFTLGEYYDKPVRRMDIWFSKFSSDGTLIFETIFGQKDFNSGKAFLPLENGDFLICGYSSKREFYTKKIVNPDTLNSIQIEKLEKEGWIKTAFSNGTGGEWKTIYQKELPLTEDQKKVRIDRDIWLGRIDKNGNLLWEKTYGGLDDDEALSMVLDHQNNLFLTGYTRSKGKGLKDIWILKIKGY